MRPLASDSVLIESGKILLIMRGHAPFKGMWALPGGFLEDNETLEACAVREMEEETGLRVKVVRLIGIYSDPNRDPRGVVSAAFLVRRANRSSAPRGADDAADAKWFSLNSLPPLAADHETIIANAILIMKNPKRSVMIN